MTTPNDAGRDFGSSGCSSAFSYDEIVALVKRKKAFWLKRLHQVDSDSLNDFQALFRSYGDGQAKREVKSWVMVKSAKRVEGHAVIASASRHFRLLQRGSTAGRKQKTHTTGETFGSCAIGFGCEKKAMGCTSIVTSMESGTCWMSKST